MAIFGAAVAATLAGCSAGPFIDKLPADMGLPAGTPPRPATPFDYPAVHAMPPPRSTEPMTEEDQVKLENDLTAVRDRQAGRPPPAKKGDKDAAKKADKDTAKKGAADVKPAKKKPAAPDNGQTAGAKPNP